MTGEATHQIGEVAERVGLSLRTVRYYEEVGLIEPSDRTAGGFRLYTDDDVARLDLIKKMKPLGFSLEEMRDLLELRRRLRSEDLEDDERAQAAEQLAAYARAAAARCEELRDELAAAEAFVESLTAETAGYRGPEG